MSESANDLTVIFLTLDRLPIKFKEYQKQALLEAIGDAQLLIVSRIPHEGWNLIDTNEPGYLNIYRQMLRAAKECDTKYIAVAEDDCLYPPEHFKLRPPEDTVLFNQHRWALFTWGVPTYSMRQRKSNSTMIAPRQLVIDALEERFAKHGDNWPEAFIGEIGRERVEDELGVTRRKSVEVFSEIGVVQLNHVFAHEERQRRKRKTLGQIKAYDIPKWGKAEDLLHNYWA